MHQETRAGRYDRIASRVLAGAVFGAPLVHAGVLADPFLLPQRLWLLLAAAIAAGLVVAGDLRGQRETSPRSPALRLALVLLLGAAMATVFSVNRGLALAGFIALASGVLVFWSAIRSLTTVEDGRRLLMMGLAGAGLVAAGAIAQAFYGVHFAIGALSLLPPVRGGATLGDPGMASQYLVLALPVGIGAAALARGMARIVAGALVGLVAGALVFIGRPEGWIAGAAVLVLILLTRVAQVAVRGRQWGDLIPHPAGDSLRAGLSALIAIVAIVGLSRMTAFLPDHRAAAPLTGTTLLVPTSGDPWTDRAASWPGTLRLAARHPLGAGPDCFRHAFLEIAWTGGRPSPFNLAHQAIHPGNSFLEMLAETGVLGGLALLALVAVLLAQAGIAAATAPPPWSAVGFASLNVMLAMIATGILGAPFQQAAPSLLFWTTAGMVQIAALASPAAGPIRARLLPLSVTRPPAPRRGRAPIVAALTLAIGAVAAGALLIDRARGSRLVLAGQAAFYAGNYEQALRALRHPVVRRLPDHLPYVLAGNACWRLGMLDRAVEEFDGALDRSPHFPGALLARAAVLQAQGRYDLAESDLNAALAVWPRNPDTQLAYARLNIQRGRLDDAITQLTAVAEASHTLAEPYGLMGDIFMRRGQVDEAINAYRICGSRNPQYPGIQTKIGDAFYRKGLHEMALRAYQAAAGLDPSAVEPRLRAANAHHAIGEYCEAYQSLKAARDLEVDTSRRAAILDLMTKVEPDCERQKKSRP